MNPSAPASAAPTPTQNPDNGAAELMSPGSIGQPVAAEPKPAANPVDAVTWMRMMRDARAAANRAALGPQIHSYIAPLPVVIPGAESISVESALQQAVAGLSGTIASQNLTDDQVAAILQDRALSVAAWSNVGGGDPGANNIAQLVAKYTAIYRTAVTPV